MGDDFRKVRAGDKFRMPAKAYNAFIDAALDHQNRQRNPHRSRRDGGMLNMADHLKRSFYGHLLRKANGHLIRTCRTYYCNGCDTLPPPTTIKAIISGITICDACHDLLPANWPDWKVTDGGDIPAGGEFCLRMPSQWVSLQGCIWTYTFARPLIITFYDSQDGSCSGHVTSTAAFDTLFVNAAQDWDGNRFLHVFIDQFNFGYWFGDMALLRPFDATALSVPNCVSGTFSNAITDCQHGPWSGAAHVVPTGFGGTISLVMNGC